MLFRSLALELAEHARAMDLGAAAGPDFGASMDHIAWAPVHQHYQDAVHAASEPFAATQDDIATALVMDVRRAAVFDCAPSLIPGAQWHDPASVGQWAGGLPADRDIVVYCVYGHEVGRATALRLRAAGLRDRKSTRLNSSHLDLSRMPSSA